MATGRLSSFGLRSGHRACIYMPGVLQSELAVRAANSMLQTHGTRCWSGGLAVSTSLFRALIH